MSPRRRTALVLLAALLGIAVAAAITYGTSQLVSQRIGLASEPITAGRALLAPTIRRAPARRTTGRTTAPAEPAAAPAQPRSTSPAQAAPVPAAPAGGAPARPEAPTRHSRDQQREEGGARGEAGDGAAQGDD